MKRLALLLGLFSAWILTSHGAAFEPSALLPKDVQAQAFRETKALAERGDVNAQYRLAQLYNLGLGVEKSDVEAVNWYRKVAEQNDPRGQSMLGVMYTNARGVPRDYAEAMKWFLRAAEQNSAHAQYNLGHMYGSGKGVTKDDAQSAEWYRKAAEQNDTGSQRILATLYATGRGVPQDLVQAYAWNKVLCDRGIETVKPQLDQLATQMTSEQIASASKLADETSARLAKLKPKSDLLAAGLRIADRFVRENKHERNYRFDLALGALLELSTVTGEAKYRNHVMQIVAKRGWTPTTQVSYREQSFTCLTYGIFQSTGDRAWLPVFLEESLKCRNDKSRSVEGAVVHPRGRERGGGEALLLDSTQEYVARMARAGAISGDTVYFAEAAKQIRLYKSIVRDPQTGLWHQGRGWLKDHPEAVSPGVWSRGHGWLLRGLTAALAEMPRDSAEYREMQATLVELADALVERQQPSGMWHCLLDRPIESSPVESSGTAMIATALARATRDGTLVGHKYRDATRRAFAALPAYVDQEGVVLSVSPGPGPLESEQPWLVESFPPGNDHGTFALMFAAAESVRFARP